MSTLDTRGGYSADVASSSKYDFKYYSKYLYIKDEVILQISQLQMYVLYWRKLGLPFINTSMTVLSLSKE